MSVRGWLLTLGLAFPTVVTYAHFVAVAGEEATANPRLQAIYSAGKVVQVALPLIFFLETRRRKNSAEVAATTSNSSPPLLTISRSVVLGLAFGLFVTALIAGLYGFWLVDSHLFAVAATHIRAKVTEFGFDTPRKYVAFAVFLALAHSLLEEYYWRWFAFGGLRTTWPFWPAALLASLAFAGHHVVVLAVYFPTAFWTTVLPFSLGIAVGGIVWCWLYERSGSLLGPWLSHALIDVAIMVVGYHLLFGQS